MQVAEIHQKLVARFGAQITGAKLDAMDPWIEVAPEAIATVGQFLKTDPDLQLDALNDLCAVDYCEPDPKKQKGFGHEPHLEIVYQLYSYNQKHKLTVKVRLPRWKGDKPGELPEVPSVSGVWAIADWHEREAYDLMGVRFTGHPNLQRILCAEDWVGHALRKDYDFPLEYHGIRGR
jgi:NADH-quinone oxidoreductase subunit C